MSDRFPYTFTVTEATGDHGHHFPLLTANEYPWMNVQIVPTPEHQRDIIMEALHRRGGGVATVEGRADFVAIQAGGGSHEHPTIEINAQNYQQVAAILNDCLQAAADFWASHHAANDSVPSGSATGKIAENSGEFPLK